LIEITDTFDHKFISHFQVQECIMVSVTVDIEGNAAHELAQIVLTRIITSQGEEFILNMR